MTASTPRSAPRVVGALLTIMIVVGVAGLRRLTVTPGEGDSALGAGPDRPDPNASGPPPPPPPDDGPSTSGGDSGAEPPPDDDDGFGFPRPVFRLLARMRPPGLPSPKIFRSPLRGPWLTSMFALPLLIGLPIVIVSGLLSYIAYGPQFGQAFPADVGWASLPFFDWPTSPSWLFRLTQGLHVTLGIILVPVVLAKLWSVVPKLFAWPAVTSIAQVLERLSLLALVGGILFEMATGLLNIQYDYIFGFSFYTAHYWGAWVFIAGFVSHTVLKLPTMVRSLRGRSLRAELRTPITETVPEAPEHPDDLIAPDPDPPSLSRRGVLGVVGASAIGVGVLSIGQTVDELRPLAVLTPRGQSYGDGPNDFQINRTAVGAGVSPARTRTWSLTLSGGVGEVRLNLAQLQAMPQHTATLPIACVEGWSTTRVWTGVRLRDLAALAGVPDPANAFVTSMEREGPFSKATLTGGQATAEDSLLALRVGGAELSLDHGYPARIIVPALPGVHCTKWVESIDFRIKR